MAYTEEIKATEIIKAISIPNPVKRPKIRIGITLVKQSVKNPIEVVKDVKKVASPISLNVLVKALSLENPLASSSLYFTEK